MDILKLSLLGRPSLQKGGEDLVAVFTYRKSLALLYFLALSPGAHSRHYLAGLLWGDMPDANARAALSRSLSDLRKHVEPYLEISAHRVAFKRSAPYWSDVELFERAISDAVSDGEEGAPLEVIPRLREAVALYRGNLLEGFYVRGAIAFEEELTIARERLHLLAIQAMRRLIAHDLASGAFQQGIQDASRLLALEPTHEATHAQLMVCLANNGQRSAALSQYAACREILKEELGVEPADGTTALYEQIRSGEIGDGVAGQAFTAPTVHWGDAPALMSLHGRDAELAQLRRWVLEGGGRLVAILGIGGQGKTMLAATFARSFASRFDVLLWQSLLNAPSLTEVVQDWLERLAPEGTASIPQKLDGKLDRLFEHLRQRRCLLILDNVESVMQSGRHAGAFRDDHRAYDQLLRRMALSDHQSCLLLTSREKPGQFAQIERQKSPVFSLVLSGLAMAAGRAVLEDEELSGSDSDMDRLVQQYSGNPLALILIADAIHHLHGGDVAAFLETESTVFGNIQSVLDQQFGRLTKLEEQIILWLAVEREPVEIPALHNLILMRDRQADVSDALRSLQRRSLVERRDTGFTLQNVLMEFATEHLVATMSWELIEGQPALLAQLPLLKASAKTYVRRTQERLLLQVVAQRLLARGGRAQAVRLLQERLYSLPSSMRRHSYAAGNILNLLVHLGGTGPLDFAGAAVWQAYLRGKDLPPIDFSHADLSGSAFTDYGGYILKLVYSPDGTGIAGSAISGEIRLWDAATRQPVMTLEGHDDFAGGLCFSPDGRVLASGGGDGTVCIWDAATGRRLHEFRAHDNAVRPVVFAADGSWLAGASFSRLTIWDPHSGELLFTKSYANGYVETMAVSPDGRILAFSNQSRIQLMDVAQTLASAEAHIVHEFHSGHNVLRQMVFSPDGQWLASCGDGVRLWNAATAELKHELESGKSRIESIAFHSQGRILAGGGRDSIFLWRVQTGDLVRAFTAHEETIISLAFSPDGETLASSSEDHTVRLWDLDGHNLHTIRGFVNMIHGIDLSPDARYLACGSDDHKVRLWDYSKGELLAAWPGHQSRVHRVVFSPDGRSLAASSRDRLVRVWAVPSGEECYQLPTGAVPYHALAWSADSRWLATGDRAGDLMLWDAASGARRAVFHHDAMVCAVAFHPTRRCVAAVCFDHKITIWDIDDGHRIQTLPGHDNEVWALAYTPDGQFLVSGSDDCTARFWHVETGKCAWVAEHHTGWIQALAFNQAGDVLLTGSQDKSVGVWDLSPLGRGSPPQLLRTLQGHTARVTDVCFGPDDASVISSSLDESIRHWSLSTGECLQTWTIPGPYAGMNITAATGLTRAQRRALSMLGAVETP